VASIPRYPNPKKIASGLTFDTYGKRFLAKKLEKPNSSLMA
jgi:hypothetical protein